MNWSELYDLMDDDQRRTFRSTLAHAGASVYISPRLRQKLHEVWCEAIREKGWRDEALRIQA